MADDVRVTNFPASTTREEVAFRLLTIIREGANYFKDEKTVLDTYARCLQATSGYRDIT